LNNGWFAIEQQEFTCFIVVVLCHLCYCCCKTLFVPSSVPFPFRFLVGMSTPVGFTFEYAEATDTANHTTEAVESVSPMEAVSPTDDEDGDNKLVSVEESPFAACYADEDEEDDPENPFSDFEIYGLNGSSNGRSCSSHACCGLQVKVGDIVRLKKTVVDVETGVEEAIVCVLVRCGRETCSVGFIPRALHAWDPVVEHINRHAQVVEMYAVSRNTQKRRKNHMNCGVAGCMFLDQINQIE
jgi:hypothetical protein